MSLASSFAALKAQRDARRTPFSLAATAESDSHQGGHALVRGDMSPPAVPCAAQHQPAAVPIPSSRHSPADPVAVRSSVDMDDHTEQPPPPVPRPGAAGNKPEPGAAGSRVRLPDIQDLELRFDAYSSERALFYAPLPKNGPRPSDFSTSTSSSAFSPHNNSRSISGSLSYSYSQLLSSSYSAPGGWAAAGISSCRPGDVLLRVRPEVAVLSTALLEVRCSACYSPPSSAPSSESASASAPTATAGKLQRCSGCKVTRYCSAGCQKRDWPAHRDECKALKAMQQLHSYRSTLHQQQKLNHRLASRYSKTPAATTPFGVGSFQDNDQVMAAAAAGRVQDVEGDGEDKDGMDKDDKTTPSESKDRMRLPSAMMRALARWIWARSRIGTGGKDKGRGDGGDLLELCSHRERFAPEQLQQQAQLAIHLAQYLTAAARAAATFGPVSRGEANLDEMMQPETVFSQGDALRALGIDSATELLDLVCQFSCNSFTLADSDLNALGVCMHASMAMLNHACIPNAAVVFPFGGAAKGGQQRWNDGDDKIMQLVALRAIEPGEELLISYVDLCDTVEERQKQLKQRYCFDCRCDLCCKSHAKNAATSSQPFASPMPLSSSQQGFRMRAPQSTDWIDPRRAVWCPNRCGGWIDGDAFETQTNAPAGAARCNKCHCVSNLKASDVANDTVQAREALEQASRLLDRGEVEAAWTRCARVVPWLVERYPPSWQPLLQLLRLATTCLIEAGSLLLSQPSAEAWSTEAAIYCFDEAVRMQMLVVAGMQASNTPIYAVGHPTRAIAIATLAKLVLAQFDHPHRLDPQGLQNSTPANAPVCRIAVEQTAAQGGKILSVLRDPPSVPDEMRLQMAKQLLQQSIEELDIGFGRSNQGGGTGREMRTALQEMEEEMVLLAKTNSLSVS